MSSATDSTGVEGCLVAVAVAAIGTVWLGAVLALLTAGEPWLPGITAAVDAVPRLVAQPTEPAAAWPQSYAEHLPAVAQYWMCTGVAGLVHATVGAFALRWWWRRPRAGTERRTPLGVDSNAAFATRRDLKPILIRRPTTGRFIVARHGRSVVATEPPPNPNQRTRGRRAGSPGAVALIGPSRSGKTTAAINGILHWDGPAVLSSVKADLLASTHANRANRGEVRIFDPTGSVIPTEQSAIWSPLLQADTPLGAQRASRALCDAGPRSGVDGGLDFWLAHAEILLSGLAYLAHHGGHQMSTLCDWVLTQDRPTPQGAGQVQATIEQLLASHDPQISAGTAQAARWVASVWDLEERTRSSVYATAQTITWPWSETTTARSADTTRSAERLNLQWLVSRANTAYLCAPLEDHHRLAPLFGGLLNDLINQAYRHVATTGRPLDPPLLVVIDEAGNTPLRALPEYASTLAGLGIILVTIWQSVAQIESAYSNRSDTILTNHLTKLFFPGISDPASLQYIRTVTGDAEVGQTSSTVDRHGKGSEQYSTARTALAPAHALRQAKPGHGLLLHGTLPPAHVNCHRATDGR